MSLRGAKPQRHSEEPSHTVIPRSQATMSLRGAKPQCHSEERSDEEPQRNNKIPLGVYPEPGRRALNHKYQP
jgi:hypothetical protein